MQNNLKIYKTLNILCVEDDERILNIYKEMFALVFQNVYFAEDGALGYETFLQNDIDIVLTDYKMPRMNGLQMSQKIRQEDTSIPIIMVTALENLEMLRWAIDINITGFIKKPLSTKTIFTTLEFVAKSILADRLLLKEQSKKIEYSSYQENLTYKKEQVIIKNDFVEEKKIANFNCEVFFRPRDVLSGDSYSMRRISQSKSLCFIVDGMGKGISASVTAMMCCAYINHLIDIKKTGSLEKIILKLIAFIGTNLLEDEVVSATFLLFDAEQESIQYAMFSMPAMLYMMQEGDDVFKIKSNNPPLANYTRKINIDEIKIQNISKLLCFSDGLNENTLQDSNKLYGEKLPDDFRESKRIEELEGKRVKSISEQEDDVTYMFFTAEKNEFIGTVYK